jgi:hypothetical protein
MQELICNVPVPKTLQELEQAIARYKTSDLSGAELLCQWQAIRDAALNQKFSDSEAGKDDKVPGEQSY